MRHIRRLHEMAAFYSHKVKRITGFPVVTNNNVGWHEKSHVFSYTKNGIHFYELHQPGKSPKDLLTLEIDSEDEEIKVKGLLAKIIRVD